MSTKKKKKKEEEEEEKKANTLETWRWVSRVFLEAHFMSFPLSVSLHFGENFLVGLERKYLGPIIYFPSSPPNQTHSKKVFLPIFSLMFFIHPISPPNKHTLRVNEN